MNNNLCDGTWLRIYHVHFHSRPFADSNVLDYYFFSASAIFDQFTAEQVGISQRAIYAMHLSRGGRYENALCTIKTERCYRKRQKNPCRGK